MGFWDNFRALHAKMGEAIALENELSAAAAPAPGRRPRGRPAKAAGAGAAAGATPGGAKRTLSDLPGILAEKYKTTGATPDEIVAEMGWKAAAPMSNLNRLIKAGSIVLVGDRYHAAQAAQRAA